MTAPSDQRWWIFWLTLIGLAYVALGAVVSCGVSPAQHAANVVDGAGYAAELTDCRAKGRAAKADGGAEAYMAAYEACASLADRKHGLDGGP